jgi:hypothetical protein
MKHLLLIVFTLFVSSQLDCQTPSYGQSKSSTRKAGMQELPTPLGATRKDKNLSQDSINYYQE